MARMVAPFLLLIFACLCYGLPVNNKEANGGGTQQQKNAVDALAPSSNRLASIGEMMTLTAQDSANNHSTTATAHKQSTSGSIKARTLRQQRPFKKGCDLRQFNPDETLLNLPCEQQCIHIRNRAVSRLNRCWSNADEPELVYAYLQARQGRRMTGRRSVWFALSIVGVVALPIVLRNYRRYRKTEQALERFIAEHVSEERMRSIKRLQFTSESIQAFYAQQDFGKTQRVKRMFEEKKVVRSRITAGDSVVTNIASGVEMQHIKHGRRRSRYSPESEQLSSISIDEEVKGSWLGRCCLNCQPSDTSGKCYEKCYVKVAAGCSLIK